MAQKEYDPAQAAAEKLDKETKKVQAQQAESADKAWQNLHEGKIQPPSENDMGPAPVAKKKGGKVSASKRADGCITKGHTRGKYL